MTNTSSNRWIDISVELSEGMVHWPGDPAINIVRVQDLDKGDSHTLSNLTMGSHSGTHVDAPAHFIKGAPSISDLMPDVLIGPARVIEITDDHSVNVEELRRHQFQTGERILFKTSNSAFWHDSTRFEPDFVHFTVDSAAYLAQTGISVIGVDYLSVGGYQQNGSQVHRLLLEAGIWLIEGLDLSPVGAGKYDLICLPLKIKHGDGAPARAVLRPTVSA
ncbi:MAG: cyclase family protein [Dehalogenimonas sp.]|uniref:Cyclase family protein n=1 Tax=Candidatus Dehalogenimonas loeffleri TaxID=3127115 RepID=A0ABZ2J3E6_9CHLR|nr:cyclase family protein [Dehalogenimonas sp.]